MVNKEQKQKYTRLHGELGKVYLKKEEHRVNTLAFYKEITSIYVQMKKEWESTKETEVEDKVDEILFDNKKKQIGELVDAFNGFMLRFQVYLAENLKVYNKLEDVMNEMITQNKNLGSPQTSYKSSREILARLEVKISAVAKSIDEAVNNSTKFGGELYKLQETYKAILLLDEFESIASDIALGIAPAEITKAFKDSAGNNTDNLYFLFKIYKPWHKEINAVLLKVMEQQLPEIKTNTNPALRQFIKDVNINTAHKLIYGMHGLIKSQQEGMVPSEKYPKLETWREFYCKPQEPNYVTDEMRFDDKYMTDEKWEEYKQFENEKIKIFHDREEKRKQEWYDAMQPFNFKYLPALNELEGDYWVLYAVEIRDRYESWKTLLEEMELVLDYEMDPELLLKPHEEFMKALAGIDWETQDHLEEKRQQRIYGKDFEKYKRRSQSYFP